MALLIESKFASGQEIWPIPPGGVSFSVSEHQLELPDDGTKPAGRAIIPHGYSHSQNGDFLPYSDQSTWPMRPSKGEVVLQGTNFYYYPFRNREGMDSFTYLVKSLEQADKNYSYIVNVNIEKGLNDDPVLQLTNAQEDGNYIFYLNEEEDTALEQIKILDPDFSGDSVELTISNNQFFELSEPTITNSLKTSYSTQSGLLYSWDLKWKDGPPPDYEGLLESQRSWGGLTLSYQDQFGSAGSFNAEVRLNQVWEEIVPSADPLNDSTVKFNQLETNASDYISQGLEGDLIYNLVEGDGLELKIPIKLYSPDAEKYQLYFKCDLNDSIYPDYPFEASFVNENTESRTSLNRVSSAKNTEIFNDANSDPVLSIPWDNNDYGHLSIRFIDDNFNSNINEPIKIELWAVPGLDPSGNKGGNTMIGTYTINVEDDLSDPITFSYDNLSGLEGSGESPSDRLVFKINENQTWEYDFYFDDPDMEFNKGKNGANPLVTISDNQTFGYTLNEAQNKITLRYLGQPNYEQQYQSSNDRNMHYFSIIIQDAEDGFSPLKDNLYIKILIEDINDVPYLTEGTTDSSDNETITVSKIDGEYDYNVSLQIIDENQKLDFSDNLLGLLQVVDEDSEDIGDNRIIDIITWEVYRFPEKGNIHSGADSLILSESQFVVSSNSGRISQFSYQPNLNEIGDDTFALKFYDSSGVGSSVLFNVFIKNEQSTPLLTKILVNHDDAKDEENNEILLSPSINTYTVFVNDGERPIIDLVFDDSSDKELISSVLLLEDQASQSALPFHFNFRGDSTSALEFFKGDESDDVVVLQDYPSSSEENEPAWVRLELKEGHFWDYDSDNLNDKNASLDFRITDVGGSQSRYKINFVTLPIDEAPSLTPLTPLEYRVDEEQNEAALNLSAVDPEGIYDDVFWEIPQGVGDNDYFQLKAASNTGTSLVSANNVGIYFINAPDYEEVPAKNDYNCTLIIKDAQDSLNETTVNLFFYIDDINDVPRPTLELIDNHYTISLEEILLSTLEEEWPTIDLMNHFIDEDADQMYFDEVVHEHYSISRDGVLSFSSPPDAENDQNGALSISVRVGDGGNLKWDGSIQVQFSPVPEPPIYNLGDYGKIIPRFIIEEDTNFTADSDHSTSPANLSPGEEPNIISLYLFDPEGTDVTILEQSVTISYPDYFDEEGLGKDAIFQSAFNGDENRFSFSPPPNAPGLYTVEFDAVDGDGFVLESAIFEFNVTDVSDPPIIEYEIISPNEINPDLGNVPSYVVNTTDDPERIIIFAHEGESGPLLSLSANDLYDRISPHTGAYEWSIEGLDSTAFKLKWNTRTGLQTNQLQWQSIPDFGNPPLSGNPYTINLKLKEDTATEEESDELKLEVWLISIPNERPLFAVDEFDYFRSKSEDDTEAFIMQVFASDPDADDEIDYLPSPRSYAIVPEKGDADRFVIDSETGELFFNYDSGWSLDYENVTDADQDREFEVLVRATKLSMPNEPSEQWIRVAVENVVEPPVFEQVESSYPDANFSIIEQTDDIVFEIFASSVDAIEKEVALYLSPDSSGNDNQFFKVQSDEKTNSLRFSFQVPPDFENPADLNSDNNYTISVVADCAGAISSETFTIRVEDVLFYPEIRSTPLDNESSLTNQVMPENQSYILKLDVQDPENSTEYKDLLFMTSEHFGFLPVVPETNENTANVMDAAQLRFPESNELFSARKLLVGDFRNVGTNDVVVLDNISDATKRIRYFENSNGFGDFKEDVNIGSILSDKLDGWIPNHGTVCDIDDDGDFDLVVSVYDPANSQTSSRIIIFLNNYDYSSTDRINFTLGVDSIISLTSDDGSLTGISILETGIIKNIAVCDIDSDYDLDLVAIHSGGAGVVWYENYTEWNNDFIDLSFRFGGTIANSEHGVSEAFSLRTFDGSNYQNTFLNDEYRMRDVLIGSESGLFHASPVHGEGGVSYIVNEVVAPSQLEGEEIKSMEIALFYKDSQNRHGVVFNCVGGAAYYLTDLGNPNLKNIANNIDCVAVLNLPNEDPGFPSLFLSNSSTVSVFKSDLNSIAPDYSKHGELSLDTNDEPVISMSFVDLNRRWTFLDYEIEDAIGFFDSRRINGDGRLFFRQIPDFDNPKGTGNGTINSNFYEAKIIVRKAHNPDVFASKKVLVRITDTNEVPQFLNIPSSVNHIENVLEVFPSIDVLNPEKDENVKFSIIGGADSALFEIDENSGMLVFRDHPNFVEESANIQKYELVLRVEESDDSAQFSDHSLQIVLEDGSELPIFNPVVELTDYSSSTWVLDPSDRSLSVDIREDGKGYTFKLSDFNASDYNNELVPPPLGLPMAGILSNSFAFEKQPIHGTVMFSDNNESFIYEPNPDYYGSDELIIRVLNTAGHPAYQKMIFNVLPEPDLPRPGPDMNQTVTVPEGQLKVSVLNGYDPDGTPVKWSLSSEFTEDFLISNNVLYFKTAPDYEDPLWETNSAFEVTLLLTSNGDTVEHSLKLDIQNINDLPPTSILDLNKTLQVKVGENISRVIDLEVSDPDGLADWDGYFIVKVVDSPDENYFEVVREKVVENGKNVEKFYLQTIDPFGLDFENPLDFNQNNLYDLNIYVGENPLGSAEVDRLGENYSLKVSVVNMDETPPRFISANGSDLNQLEMVENKVFAGQVIAEDEPEVPGVKLSYSLSGGEDAELFWVHEDNGKIEFFSPPNYESPKDFNRNNIYDIQVMATDGSFAVYQNVEITVVDANDFPNVVQTVHYGVEDQVYEGNLSFIDEDGDLYQFVTYSLPEFGELQLFEDFSFSYTPPPHFTSVDTFTVTLADPYGEATREVQIFHEPVNDPPAAEDDYVFYTDLQRSNRLRFDVLANDHAGVDAPAVENYTVVSHTQPNVVQGFSNLGDGYFSYSPASGFLGEDTFTYTIADQNDSSSRSSATVRIWIAKTASFPDWTYLRHFGAFMEMGKGWIYHHKLGWLYAQQPEEIITSATWIWSEVLGWFWTGEKYFKWVYVDDLIGHSGKDEDRDKKWLLWNGDLTKNNNWFLKDKSDRIYSKDDFSRLKIRNEIIEILPNLEELSDFIAEHEYFSADQIITIITELNRFKRSSTLNQILEFDFQY